MQVVRKPKIIIRTDASSKIGLGHVRRCLSLADALTELGIEIEFHLFGDHFGKSMVTRAGYVAAPVKSRDGLLSDERHCQVDGIITDTYAFSENHYRAMAKVTPMVVALDDMGLHFMPVDIVINQNISSKEIDYSGRDDTKFLMGPKYALLNNKFGWWRERRENEDSRVLITMGGSDLNCQTEKAIHALFSLPATFYVDVIIGSGAQSIENVKNDASLLPMVSYVHVDPPDIASLMARASVAICAGGVTALELACLGVPSLTISVADNQIEPAQALHESGASIYLGHYDDVSRETLSLFLKGLLFDFNKRAQISAAGRLLVDGDGAKRAAKEIISCLAEKTGMAWVTQKIGGIFSNSSFPMAAI